jgi:D-alanyl-D-alanine carboxypeptidase/D-alanyl-D-alanine-endopeptidase (penicillin-binding protein 4)
MESPSRKRQPSPTGGPPAGCRRLTARAALGALPPAAASASASSAATDGPRRVVRAGPIALLLAFAVGAPATATAPAAAAPTPPASSRATPTPPASSRATPTPPASAARGTTPSRVAAWSIPAAYQASALTSTLDHELGRVGSGASAYVLDLTTGASLFSERSTVPRIPASVQKLYTMTTALLRFGPEDRLATRVYALRPPDAAGILHDDLYLRGGGDPTFGNSSFIGHSYDGQGATVGALVHALIAGSGLKQVQGRVVGDESFLDSRRGGPRTGYAHDSDIEGDLSGLAFDRGARRERGTGLATTPAAFAAARLSHALRSSGVHVSRRARTGRTPPHSALLAQAVSPPMRTLAALTLGPSDNFFAEMLLKDLGATFGGRGSTPAGAGVVSAQIAALGIHPTVVDSSGLSRADHTSPRQLVALLAKLRSLPIGPALIGALPVAGRSGTLVHRMRGTAAQGRCQAKTGTLDHVSNLAGYCRAADGHTLAFAFLMNSVDVGAAHSAQDAMASALARYDG